MDSTKGCKTLPPFSEVEKNVPQSHLLNAHDLAQFREEHQWKNARPGGQSAIELCE
jgi:hypothetical protein